MKVLFTTFFCTLFLFLSAQQSDTVIQSDLKKDALISCRVVDEKGSPVANVQIEVIDSTTQVIANSETDSAGYSKISVPPGRQYELVFSKSGYLFQTVIALIPDSGGYEKTLKDITLQSQSNNNTEPPAPKVVDTLTVPEPAVQRQYIYHAPLKESKSVDSTTVVRLPENKDTIAAIIKDTVAVIVKGTIAVVATQAKSIDPINITPILENKDTVAAIVNDTVAAVAKQAESIDSIKTEPAPPAPVVHSLKIEIKNAGQQINSSFADYTPLLSADGNMLIVTSRRPLKKKDIQKGKEGLEKVYVTYYDDKNGKWLEPKMLGETINLTDMNNSAIALSNDGQQMLMYHAGTDLVTNGDVFESQLYTAEWSDPVKLSAPINSDDNETSANLSPDGKTIYFVSDRKGGLGGKDIWYCTQNQQGKWGEALNMGESVNSAKDEESVFIHPSADGNVIFFSSKGHNSAGGYDIFMSVFDEITQKWKEAENLGAPLNTAYDDISFVLEANGKTGYYASSKPGGFGDLDIYNIAVFEDIMKTSTALLEGRVINRNGNSIAAVITFKNKSNDKLMEPVKSNKATGQYFVKLPTGKKYEIKVTAYGYNTYTGSVDITYKTTPEEIFKNIVLDSKNAFISSRVLDEKGSPLNNVLIEVVDKSTYQIIASPRSNSAGYSLVSVPFGKNVDVVFSKPGYLFQTVNTLIPDSAGYEQDLKDIILPKIEVGKKTVLSAVYFDLNQITLRKESNLELLRIVKLMNEMTSLQIEISGHTDNQGSQLYNNQFSEAKAKAVVSNLLIKGGDKNRLKYTGYGPNQPIAINFTRDGRKANNRIELKVLKVDLVAEQVEEAKRVKEIVTDDQQQEQEQGEGYSLLSDSIKIKVKDIGSLVNTSFAEYAPLVSADGHTMTFTSRRPVNEKSRKKGKEGVDNVFVSYYNDKNEKWMEPKMLEPAINIPNTHNSALALPNDGQQMLVYHSETELNATGDIYEHLLLGKDWCIPLRALSAPINSSDNETSISFSPDGRIVYFVSDRQGGLGGKDIWYATQDEDGIYSEAVNMGPTINTAADEESVFIHPSADGKVIFFSSKGHNSVGGYDIFMSVFDESAQSWTKPENIGLPINTYGDDISFSLSSSGKTGYYASAKPGKTGDLDIYSAEFSQDIIKKNTTILKGRVANKNNRPLKSIIVVKNKITDKVIDIVKSDKETGNYAVPIVSGTRVEVEYNAFGYYPYKEAFDIGYKPGFQKIVKNVSMETNNGFISSKVLDEKRNPLSDVRIKVTDRTINLVISKFLTDSTGYTLIALPLATIYNVAFSKFGYFHNIYNVVIPDLVGYEKDLNDVILRKVDLGKKTILSTVTFDPKDMSIPAESGPELQSIVMLMNEMPSLQLQIIGHTDSTVSLKNSMKLSEQRAKIVMDSLIMAGCNSNRLSYIGYGSTRPLAGNNTEEGRKTNNLIEIKVMDVDLSAERKAEKKRLQKAIIIPPKKEKKNVPVIEDESLIQTKKTERAVSKPLPERLKKYDIDNNGIISYEELLAAMDTTRSELSNAIKPAVAPEQASPVSKEEPMEPEKVSPVSKEEPREPEKKNTNSDDEAKTLLPAEAVKDDKTMKPDSLKNNQNIEQKIALPKKPMEERFIKYDTDKNGLISYDEILNVIDSFLKDTPKAKGDENMVELISQMIDYYFEQ